MYAVPVWLAECDANRDMLEEFIMTALSKITV